MKKVMYIMFLVLMGVVMFSTAEDTAAEEKDYYSVIIEVYDQDENKLTFDSASFFVESGEARVNGGTMFCGLSGAGFTDILHAKMTDDYMLIDTVNSEDINFILDCDSTDCNFYIEDTIPFEKLEKNEIMKIKYNLKDLKKITIDTSVDDKREGDFQYYLFKKDSNKKSQADSVSGRRRNLEFTEKDSVYVSNGEYRITFINSVDTLHRIYKLEDYNPWDQGDVHVNVSSDEFNEHKVDISKIYDEYPYYCILLSNDSQSMNIWNDRNGTGKIDVQFHRDFNSEYTKLYLSNEMEEKYNKSTSVRLKKDLILGGGYHYREITTSKNSSGKTTVDVVLRDDNGNDITFIDIARPHDVSMRIYDRETEELIGTYEFSSYWDYLELSLDKNRAYVARVYSEKNKNVNGVSYFNLLFDQEGVPRFRFRSVVFK